jgi:hypothetical protein
MLVRSSLAQTQVPRGTSVSGLSRAFRQAAPILDYAWYPMASTANPASFCFAASVRECPVKLLDGNDGRVSEPPVLASAMAYTIAHSSEHHTRSSITASDRSLRTAWRSRRWVISTSLFMLVRVCSDLSFRSDCIVALKTQSRNLMFQVLVKGPGCPLRHPKRQRRA